MARAISWWLGEVEVKTKIKTKIKIKIEFLSGYIEYRIKQLSLFFQITIYLFKDMNQFTTQSV